MKYLYSLEEIIKIGLKFKFNWFRGHTKTYDDLTPKVFRQEYNSELHKTASSDFVELHIIEEFKRLAPSFGTECPKPADHLQWLILMQHYGTPTRLLDWTESILVATFFAVNDHSKEDAEIWRLYPQKLNQESIGYEGFPIIAIERHLTYLAEESICDNLELLTTKFNLAKPIDVPVAFYPVLSFPRITAQGGVFSIHPKPNLTNSIIEMFKNQPNYLSRYIIPSNKKVEILSDLYALGINYRTLFANLDGLSKDISIKYKNPLWNVWGQPFEEE